MAVTRDGDGVPVAEPAAMATPTAAVRDPISMPPRTHPNRSIVGPLKGLLITHPTAAMATLRSVSSVMR